MYTRAAASAAPARPGARISPHTPMMLSEINANLFNSLPRWWRERSLIELFSKSVPRSAASAKAALPDLGMPRVPPQQMAGQERKGDLPQAIQPLTRHQSAALVLRGVRGVDELYVRG